MVLTNYIVKAEIDNFDKSILFLQTHVDLVLKSISSKGRYRILTFVAYGEYFVFLLDFFSYLNEYAYEFYLLSF